jgi:hypothetical protein
MAALEDYVARVKALRRRKRRHRHFQVEKKEEAMPTSKASHRLKAACKA